MLMLDNFLFPWSMWAQVQDKKVYILKINIYMNIVELEELSCELLNDKSFCRFRGKNWYICKFIFYIVTT